MKLPRLFVAAAAVLLMSACAQPAPTSPASTPSPEPATGAGTIAGTHWQLTELDGKPLVKDSVVTASFADDGVVTGSGGCNRFRAAYTVSENTIKIDEAIGATMMACAEDVMAQETAFFATLSTAGSFTMTAEVLTLANADGTEVAKFAVQSQELAGTQWKFVSYNNGKEAVVIVLEGTEATLSFADDKTVSGSGGCNRITGGFTAADGQIKFDQLAMTAMACPEPEGVMEQEAAVVKALESAATYTIEGNQLEMRTAGDATAVVLTRV